MLASSAPSPIEIAPPGTLFTIITPNAPWAWAARILNPNSQVPLLITAIFPAISLPFVILWQASYESPLITGESVTRASSAVNGFSLGSPTPKPAGIAG